MALSPFAQRSLQRIEDTGFARAKKLADLATKTNTDSSGSATARGYEQAVSYLQPFLNSAKESDALDAQRLIAAYGNSMSKIATKQRDQTETVSAFKLQEMDAYFSSFDGDVGSFRNPASLIDVTSQALDGLTLGVINAIDQKQANGDSTDQLSAYLNDLNKRSDMMRGLKNKFDNGELNGKTLDGFGYYVDTNPMDGSIRGAAILPAGIAPADIAKGYRRLEATTKVGGALLPVYAPTEQNAMGEYTARIGDATWNGTGNGALSTGDAKTSKNLFQEGGFDITDNATYPVRKTSVGTGSFGKGFIGKDATGNPVEAIFYRGNDNKLYSVDQASLDRFKQDPLLSKKLDGYIPQFSPSEVKSLSKEAIPFSESGIQQESKITGLQSQADTATAQADAMENTGFFSKVKQGLGMAAAEGRAAVAAPRPQSSFFDRKNVPNKPEVAPTGGTPADIIASGQSFFRKVGGFISGQPQ